MIPKDALNHRFWLVSANSSLSCLVDVYASLPAEERMQWYVLCEPEEGGWVILSAGELFQAIERGGEESLSQPLSVLTSSQASVRTLERQTMGIGQARREMHRQPGRRLVVLEKGRPVGLLCDVFRAGLFGGLPLELYGRKQDPVPRHTVAYSCPHCERENDFVDLIDLETDRLICPHCRTPIVEHNR